MECYKINDEIPLRENGVEFASGRIARKFLNDKRSKMIEIEIIKLASSYQGVIKLGAKLEIPEDGFVGTFTNPES